MVYYYNYYNYKLLLFIIIIIIIIIIYIKLKPLQIKLIIYFIMKTVFFICCLCSLFLMALMQMPKDKAINGCGLNSYKPPTNENECFTEPNCCYFSLNKDDTNIMFCAKVPKVVTSEEDYKQVKTKFINKIGLEGTTEEHITVKCN